MSLASGWEAYSRLSLALSLQWFLRRRSTQRRWGTGLQPGLDTATREVTPVNRRLIQTTKKENLNMTRDAAILKMIEVFRKDYEIDEPKLKRNLEALLD